MHYDRDTGIEYHSDEWEYHLQYHQISPLVTYYILQCTNISSPNMADSLICVFIS